MEKEKQAQSGIYLVMDDLGNPIDLVDDIYNIKLDKTHTVKSVPYNFMAKQFTKQIQQLTMWDKIKLLFGMYK